MTYTSENWGNILISTALLWENIHLPSRELLTIISVGKCNKKFFYLSLHPSIHFLPLFWVWVPLTGFEEKPKPLSLPTSSGMYRGTPECLCAGASSWWTWPNTSVRRHPCQMPKSTHLAFLMLMIIPLEFFFIYKVARNVRKMHKLQLSQVIRLFILTACEPVVFTFVVIPNRPVWKTPALFVIWKWANTLSYRDIPCYIFLWSSWSL